mmetsp:Transcript_65074/g.108086  ORF Transcript_65074/g.108086 Transcript_65074/m.108086 type:complete len:233 (+) Transcript_65074:502-1200(+)
MMILPPSEGSRQCDKRRPLMTTMISVPSEGSKTSGKRPAWQRRRMTISICLSEGPVPSSCAQRAVSQRTRTPMLWRPSGVPAQRGSSKMPPRRTMTCRSKPRALLTGSSRRVCWTTTRTTSGSSSWTCTTAKRAKARRARPQGLWLRVWLQGPRSAGSRRRRRRTRRTRPLLLPRASRLCARLPRPSRTRLHPPPANPPLGPPQAASANHARHEPPRGMTCRSGHEAAPPRR